MKTYAYLRVSTDKQTFMQQQQAINDSLKNRCMKVDEFVQDEGISGSVSYKDRSLYKLILRMEAGDCLVVSEISRLGRSMADLSKLINDELKPRKLRLIVTQMALDLDCSRIKAIDEMILFAFSFSAQLEKELIQDRTRQAMTSIKEKIKSDGEWVSKKGHVRTGLGRAGLTEEERKKASLTRMLRAQEDPKNIFLERYLENSEKQIGKKVEYFDKLDFENIADQLNNLGQVSSTGKKYNGLLIRALATRIRDRKRMIIQLKSELEIA